MDIWMTLAQVAREMGREDHALVYEEESRLAAEQPKQESEINEQAKTKRVLADAAILTVHGTLEKWYADQDAVSGDAFLFMSSIVAEIYPEIFNG